MRVPFLALALLLVAAQPAGAHRLKVFATVDDGAIAGYAFFIGGGRPQAATIVIRDAEGRELYRGVTDAQGIFAWRAPQPADFTVLIDARDGHVAETRIAADRFAGTSAGPVAAVASPSAPPGAASPPAAAGGIDPAMLADVVDRSVDRAVARQVRPLLEAYDAAEGRVRFNDIAGGLGMIVGLAGIALWAASRRRAGAPPADGA